MAEDDAAGLAPDFDEVEAAAARLEGLAARTPLLSFPAVDAALRGRVYIKPETLQRTGSFKFRGAYNALARLDEATRSRGVIAFSSGNHAQGVAEAARLFGVPATIVMPTDAPKVKADGVRARGGEVVGYDRATQDREAISAELREKTGAAIIPSFDHPDIIAGQGTVGLETFRDLAAMDVRADQLICCVGGGGLTAGINIAAERLSPGTRVYGAEPEGFDDHRRSLASGRIEENERRSGSLCDALLSERPGRITFAINKRRFAGIGVVSDEEALQAVAFAFADMKLVVEPGGAAALAACLSGKIECRDRTSVIVLTGGNVDPAIFARAISG